MPLLLLRQIELSVGGPLLLDHVDLGIEAGERICVIGRNGEGKSTLLRLIEGSQPPDGGEIQRQPGLRIARLEQEVPAGLDGSVESVLASGLGEHGRWLAEFHQLSASADAASLARLAVVQQQIEQGAGWAAEQRLVQALQRLQLDGEQPFGRLSGGMQRRVLLAALLLAAPDLLLLDEPTNHLDIEAIEALQTDLLGFRGALVFVTHDRAFLRALATRIVEIDRGQLSSWPGDYDNYLRRREERRHAEALAQAQFDRKLAEEEVWIRKGIEARRTRNEGRVRALLQLRRERAARREAPATARLRVTEAGKSGRRVIRADGLGYGLPDGRWLVRDLDLRVQRGDRVGLIGPNGAGKTTLLRLLLGELAPSTGEVELGTGLEIAYFDQYRAQLDDSRTALDNVAEGREFIELDGRRQHIYGYLQDFLFTPERARAPITRLSGGERNRLLLARLFSKPANLLVLDEPTNDLDMETLELLEARLVDYGGTVLVVSHDRAFLDNVVTSTLTLLPSGRVIESVGGYSDRRLPAGAMPASNTAAAPARAASKVTAAAPSVAEAAPARRKLSYKDQRELDTLPQRIEALEQELAQRTAAMNEPGFYQREAAAIQADQQTLAERQTELEQLYGRWETLEG
ncbi:MAG: ATP-binding cassette domain-containing protein [Xanthomonadales bacterium]|nr:ATP-binding cassette domain-containing protein [Xanthomonadales bacterium]